MKTEIVNNEVTIEAFIDAMNRGAEAVKDACQILVKLVELDPRVFDKIVAKCPRTSYNMLGNLLRVGRGVLHVESLFDDSPAARRVAALPIEMQREAYEKPISVAKIDGDKIVMEQKPVKKLTPQEIKSVFVNNHIATIEEQVATIKSRSVIGVKGMPSQRYEIDSSGSVHILKRTVFTAAQIQEIAEKSATKAKASLETSMKKNQTKK